MAIYLDTNILWPWRTFTELYRIALSIVARQTDQEVLIPQIAAQEAEAHYRRSLEGAVARFLQSAADLDRIFGYAFEETTWASPEDHTHDWRNRLDELGAQLPLDGADAIEALRREIWGWRPAKPRAENTRAAGARDAAIWLTVVRDHRKRDEEGHFISRDKTDYARGDDLKPELLQDLEGSTHPMRLYDGIDEFLALLGEPSDLAIDLTDLQARTFPGLVRALELKSKTALMVCRDLPEKMRCDADIVDGEVTRLISARRYARGSDAVTVVNAEWTFNTVCRFQEADTTRPEPWIETEDIEVEASVQFYLADEGGEERDPQVITADVTAPTTLRVRREGEGEYSIRSLTWG